METERTQDLEVLSRRQLLQTAAGVGLTLALSAVTEEAPAAPGKWVAVGKNSDFQKDVPRKITLAGGGLVFVTRTGANTFDALSARCSHQGCEVGWDKANKEFLCPCHGATFAPNGKNRRGPAKGPLPSLPVRQQGKLVMVNLTGAPASALKPGASGEEHEHEEHKRGRKEHGDEGEG